MLQRFAPAVALIAVLATPVGAEQETQPDPGRGLMERGVELFLEGLTQEMAPALNDLREMAEQFGPAMQSFLEEMGPAFAEILSEVKDWSRYEPPEILPNGDIIIRRKPDPKDEPQEGEEMPPSGPTDI